MRIGLETKVEPDNVFQVVGRDGGNGGGSKGEGGECREKRYSGGYHF